MRNEMELREMQAKIDANIHTLQLAIWQQERMKGWDWHQLALLKVKAQILGWVLGEEQEEEPVNI